MNVRIGKSRWTPGRKQIQCGLRVSDRRNSFWYLVKTKVSDTFSSPPYLYDATKQATRASIRVFDPQHQHQAGMIGLVSNHRGAKELRLQGRIGTEQ